VEWLDEWKIVESTVVAANDEGARTWYGSKLL
jgi:hypothetical protein